MNIKTTIELPEGLVTEAKIRAATESTTLRELVIRGLQQLLHPPQNDLVLRDQRALQPGSEPFVQDGLGWPVLEPEKGSTAVTNDFVNKMREELGI